MTFEGFKQPTKNYFPMPNNWPDISAEINNLAELKIVEYVLRHTWGFHEFGICKTISVDEFMHGRRKQDDSRMDKGTGLSEQSVRNGLKKAIKDGYLVYDIDPSDAGRIKKSYALKMVGQVQTLDPPQTLDPSTGTNFIPQGTNLYTSDSQSLDPRVPNFIPRTEKDTIEKHYKKDTIEKKGDVATSNEDRNAPSPIILEVEKKKRETNPRLPVIKLDTKEKTSSSAPDTDTPVQHSGAHPEPSPIRADAAQGNHVTEASNGTTKRTRARKPVEKEPPFTLDSQQQAFWDLWCNVWFNAEIKPVLTETAYRHVAQLAPYITDAEKLNSLIEYTRKDLADSIGMKRKMVQLGNMVHCYTGWKQSQPIPIDKEAQAKEKNVGVSGLPRLKGLGEQQRYG